MGAVTYPHAGVERRLTEHFVCVRPQIDVEKDLAEKFMVRWTPGLVFLDGQEGLHYRAFGFHPPEMCEHLLDIGRGMVMFNLGRFDEAVKAFTEVVEDKESSPLQAEAHYWLGVARYKAGDKEALAKTWDELLTRQPKSAWASKAGFIRKKAAPRRRQTG
jgi:tetratricopeptide (TPR) repeat protein